MKTKQHTSKKGKKGLKLTKFKNYPWRQNNNIYQQAREKGLKPTKYENYPWVSTKQQQIPASKGKSCLKPTKYENYPWKSKQQTTTNASIEWVTRQQQMARFSLTSMAGFSRTFQTWYKFSVEFCKQRQSRGRIQSRSDSKLAFTGKYPVALVSHGRGERLSHL